MSFAPTSRCPPRAFSSPAPRRPHCHARPLHHLSSRATPARDPPHQAIKFTSSGLFWDEDYAAAQTARLATAPQAADKLRGLVALCNTAVVDVKPKHWEVQRRLTWFVASLLAVISRDLPVIPP